MVSDLMKKILMKHQMKTIFIIFFLIFTIIPSFAYLIISDIYTKKTIKNYSNQYLNTTANMLSSNISDMIYQINLSSITLTSLPEITGNITSDISYKQKSDILNQNLSDFVGQSAIISGIIIKTHNNETFCYLPDGTYTDFDDSDFLASLSTSQPSVYNECIAIGDGSYIVIGRKFFNFNTGEDIGTMLFLIDESYIFSAFNESIIDSNNFFLICNNRVISHSDKSYLNMHIFIPEQIKKSLDETKFSVVEYPINASLKDTELKLIGLLSSENEYLLIKNVKNRIYTLCAAAIIFSVILAIILAKRLTRSLHEFKQQMEFFADNPELEQNINKSNEISELAISFDKMINHIRNLTRLNNIEKEKQRDAELRAMQAQISPHFIYNALDTAYCIAKLKGEKDIEDILYALATFFRLGLHNASRTISVRDEIEHVKSFLVIEKLRFPQLFNVSYDINKEIYDHKMIGVIIQPIVENSIKHGFKDIDYMGELKITGRREDDTIIFEISDNGHGMDTIPTLSPSDNGGYGLYNINERLVIAYGPEYAITINTQPAHGTTVIVRIPI